MANITRIKSKSDSESKDSKEITKIKATEAKDKASAKKAIKDIKSKKEKKERKKIDFWAKIKKLPFLFKLVLSPLLLILWILTIIFRPFVLLGRYMKSSWGELREVRWPKRLATWKMVLSIVVYSALFIVIVIALDALFSLIFNNLLG